MSLEDIKKRLGEATSSPWDWKKHIGGSGCRFVFDAANAIVADVVRTRDGPFIAHAPEDISQLVIVAEYAQKVLDADHNQLEHACENLRYAMEHL